jgi:asparagine synthase (glutamine-hydrolysing)
LGACIAPDASVRLRVMCGIVGVVGLGSGASIDPHLVCRMRDTMVHRGPDGAGLWLSRDRQVGLGHRRLAILDLSDAASQPMVDASGEVAIVFNGEIYNHAQIRRELEALGSSPWRTDHSDTEVILHSFLRWGIGCLDRFRGMFGLGVWDGRTRELWLARDRRGVKPVYWAQDGGRFAFASEIKALLADPSRRREIDHRSLYHYLSFLTTPAPQTLFRGIRKLPAGGLLHLSADGRVTERQWYDLGSRVQPVAEQDEREVAARLLEELRTSVKLRKVSDVPVGVFLSGGVDSSTNVALFSEGESSEVKSFCIGYSGSQSYASETSFAREMADRVGAEHHERLLTIDDLIDFVPRMIELQDEPIADPVCVPVYYVSKLARDNGVIVAQVGEGSDELFWGYSSWRTYSQLYRWNSMPVPRALRRLALVGTRAMGWGLSSQWELLRRGTVGEPIFWSGAEAFREAEKQSLLGPDLRRELSGYSSWDVIGPMYRYFQQSNVEQAPVQWMAYADLHLRLPELLLMRVDKMGMGASVEGRVPFLDHVFVEYAMGIPAAMKTAGGQSKHILKRAVRGLIPDSVIDRPKQGFGAPVHEWFQQRLGGMMRDSIERFVRETELLDPRAVRAVLDSGRGTESWYLYNLSKWWETYIG